MIKCGIYILGVRKGHIFEHLKIGSAVIIKIKKQNKTKQTKVEESLAV